VVIGLQAYTLRIIIIFVLLCTVGINAVRANDVIRLLKRWTWYEWFYVRRHSSILKFGAVLWRCRYTNFAVTSKTVASGHSSSFGIGQIFWLPVN